MEAQDGIPDGNGYQVVLKWKHLVCGRSENEGINAPLESMIGGGNLQLTVQHKAHELGKLPSYEVPRKDMHPNAPEFGTTLQSLDWPLGRDGNPEIAKSHCTRLAQSGEGERDASACVLQQSLGCLLWRLSQHSGLENEYTSTWLPRINTSPFWQRLVSGLSGCQTCFSWKGVALIKPQNTWHGTRQLYFPLRIVCVYVGVSAHAVVRRDVILYCGNNNGWVNCWLPKFESWGCCSNSLLYK